MYPFQRSQKRNFLGGWDSNPQPPACSARTLPAGSAKYSNLVVITKFTMKGHVYYQRYSSLHNGMASQ